MANQRIAKLTAPTISLTGTSVGGNSDLPKTTGTFTINAGVFEGPNSNDTSSKQFSIDNGRIGRELTFVDNVEINMSVAGHTLRTRSNTSVPASRPTFYGDLAGVLNDSPQTDAAEIRYTVNGKDPSKTKFYRWGVDEGNSIGLQMNKAGGSYTVLKARTYYRGRWSDVTTVRIRIANETTNERITVKRNSDDNGNVIGDPVEGQPLATDNN